MPITSITDKTGTLAQVADEASRRARRFHQEFAPKVSLRERIEGTGQLRRGVAATRRDHALAIHALASENLFLEYDSPCSPPTGVTSPSYWIITRGGCSPGRSVADAPHGKRAPVLARALTRRRPLRGLIFHSDRGTEYMGAAFCAFVARHGLQQRASVRGPSDNARAESFFHSLKTELTRGVVFPTEAALRQALTRYIRWYNVRRLHSALDYRSPVAFEGRAT